ncbi:MAG: RAD55 family ATPase [Methanobacteriota archaeon]
MKAAIGIQRLDELLKGGLPSGTFTLLHGPPFSGKKILARSFGLQGTSEGVPAIFVLTDTSAAEERERLLELSPKYLEAEAKGLVHIVDLYSKAIGAAGTAVPNTTYTDGPLDLNGLAMAVNEAEAKLLPEHEHHRVVLQSVSTLVAYTNAQTAFRFLQVFIGRTKRAGATGLLTLEGGMHPEAEVQMVKHLADGMIELKRESTKSALHVQGYATDAPGWIEYRSDEKTFELTGSFAAGRIR